MKPFTKARVIMDAVPSARDDLTQIRDDISFAVDVITIVAVVAVVTLIAHMILDD